MTKRNLINSATLSRFLVALIWISACVFVGCNSQNSASDGSSTGSPKLPKLNLHRPKDVAAAVVRLRSLVEAIAADGEFPDPLKYRVREVIHGTGAAAHSHYYLVDENGVQVEEEEDGHEHMESDEKFHDVEVEPYTEMVDLAQWLPHLAADADITEDTWNQVRSISKEMVDALRSVEESTSDSEKRDAFRTKAKEFEGWLVKLENSLGMESKDSN